MLIVAQPASLQLPQVRAMSAAVPGGSNASSRKGERQLQCIVFNTGVAWLSLVRIVKIQVNSTNGRNPYC